MISASCVKLPIQGGSVENRFFNNIVLRLTAKMEICRQWRIHLSCLFNSFIEIFCLKFFAAFELTRMPTRFWVASCIDFQEHASSTVIIRF